MRAAIESELTKLIGLPFLSAGRAGTLEWFHFGVARTLYSVYRGPRAVGDVALHVQCAWRLIGVSGIVTGSSDYFYSAEPDHAELPASDLDVLGTSLLDRRIAEFRLVCKQTPIVVQAVACDEVGSIRIEMSEGYRLEVFPDTSRDTEHWRLLRPGDLDSHFVVIGSGIGE